MHGWNTQVRQSQVYKSAGAEHVGLSARKREESDLDADMTEKYHCQSYSENNNGVESSHNILDN